MIRGFLGAAFFYYSRLALNGSNVVDAVGTALAAGPADSVIDLGCGCGWFCQTVPGQYLGIDLNSDYLQFARWRWGRPQRRFERMLLEDLAADAQFDRAIMASVLHHMSDDVAHGVLKKLACMVRSRLVVLDLNPDASGPFQTFLLSKDRGEHIRPPARQRAILAEHFNVVEQSDLQTTTRSAVHTLFVCEPYRQ